MSTETPDLTKLVAESQRQTLAVVGQAHEAMLKTTEIALGSIPAPVPQAWKAPAAAEIVAAGYNFAGKVLTEQKAFALRLTELVVERADEGRKNLAQAFAQE